MKGQLSMERQQKCIWKWNNPFHNQFIFVGLDFFYIFLHGRKHFFVLQSYLVDI